MIDLRLGDCTQVLKQIPSSSIDCIITDPPYDVSISGGGTVNNVKKLNKSLSDLSAANIDSGYDIITLNKEFIRVMKQINIYIWCNKKQIKDYFNLYVNEYNCKFEIICWHKTNALPTYSNKYLSDTEYCLYFHKGGEVHPGCYEDAKTYYLSPINIADKKLYGHPTIKPLDIIEKFVRNSTNKGDVILDPFMGSGTTGLACKNNDRNFIGIEINEQYFTVAQKRIGETSTITLKNKSGKKGLLC